jgi:single-stranded-DNA-specific exonuclease
LRRRKAWQIYPEQPELVAEIMARHNLPRLVARILVNRGLAAADDIQAFLDPCLERLIPPFGLHDLETAATRLGQAVRQGEPVAVYGDYDADGLTATALLHQFFRELGLTCFPYIPDRLADGYGLKLETLKDLKQHARLMVTVDCGISDAREVAWAGDQGLEVIITDHHEVPPELPPALAVVNPKRPGHAYPFSELAGVGVALLLALGLRAELRAEGWFRQRPEPNLKSYLDLVALGTAADMMPLTGENRILVRQGLKVLEESRRPGIIALKEAVGLEGKPISYRDAVFRLAPKLNAAGRLGQARCALELLINQDLRQARLQADYLDNLNRQRQALEEEVLQQAARLIRQGGLAARPVLVLAQEGWHPGVIGIVASRLADDYHRPVALVSLTEGRGRGSARSIEGFNLFQGLHACRQILSKYGGHAAAAGFELAADNLPAFQDLLEQAFHQQVGPQPPRPTLKVDAQAELPDLNHAFYRHLDNLRPFGPGNPPPIVVCLGVECVGSRVVGDRHLRLQLAQNGHVLDVIAFEMAAAGIPNGLLDVALSPRVSYYQGRVTPDLRLLDWGRP